MQLIIDTFDKPKLVPHQLKQVDNIMLSINHICPVWSACFEINKLPVPLSVTWLKWLYKIIFSSQCIVGEALVFSSPYASCRECCTISSIFLFYFVIHSDIKLKEKKQRLFLRCNKKTLHTRRILKLVRRE